MLCHRTQLPQPAASSKPPSAPLDVAARGMLSTIPERPLGPRKSSKALTAHAEKRVEKGKGGSDPEPPKSGERRAGRRGRWWWCRYRCTRYTWLQAVTHPPAKQSLKRLRMAQGNPPQDLRAFLGQARCPARLRSPSPDPQGAQPCLSAVPTRGKSQAPAGMVPVGMVLTRGWWQMVPGRSTSHHGWREPRENGLCFVGRVLEPLGSEISVQCWWDHVEKSLNLSSNAASSVTEGK